MRVVFEKQSFFSTSPEEVFRFHERDDAFRVLSPPSFKVDVGTTASTLAPSEDVVTFDTKVLGFRFPFAMVHTVYRPPHLFVDEQLRGFFDYWKHEHRFIQGGHENDPATLLSDRIEFGHPLMLAGSFVVKNRLGGLFEFRHDVTRRELLETMKQGEEGRHVVVTGATGLIGGRLVDILVEQGARVTVLARSPERARRRFGDAVSYAEWDFTKPERGEWKEALGEADAVVHLAGTPLFSKRWSEPFKREMEESRTLSTRQLVEAIGEADRKPEVMVTASAVGIYGTDPARLVDETSDHGDDLLARICIAWEKEARAVEEHGVRSAQIRIGVVLSPESGALKEMLPLFKSGLGGVLGAPDRWINWIHLEDVARIMLMAIKEESVSGPVNAVAPHPVTNKTLAYTLARVLRRPAMMRYPEAVMKMIIGEAGEYSSGGPRARADRSQELGYRFFFDELEPALRSLLSRPT